MTSSSGLRGHRRTHLAILESADHALFKIVRFFLSTASEAGLDVIQRTAESELWESRSTPTLINYFFWVNQTVSFTITITSKYGIP
jgi:hypothetical protein